MENLYALGTQVTLISGLFRYLSFLLDSIIYSIIPGIFEMIYSLYDITKLLKDSTQVVKTLSNTIYSFLAIFMFFRVAFSLLTMLVNPSLIEDKEKGAGKIVTNIIITLGLIVLVPILFEGSRTLQAKIIEEKLIEKAINGQSFNENSEYDLGSELSLATWSAFLSPAIDDNATCIGCSNTIEAYNAVFKSTDNKWPLGNLSKYLSKTTTIYKAGDDTELIGTGKHYQLSYVVIVSTIVGGYLLWAIVKLCIDVAYRSLKYFALEILSPIAIVSYIDPSSSKKGLFSKWVSETLKTYLSLFIRIFVFAITSLILREFSLAQFTGGFFVKIFYLLAVIAFIKTAPKFIDGLFGTELSKDGDTKFGSDLLKGAIGAVGGAAIGGIGSAVVAGKTKQRPLSFLKNTAKGSWQGGSKGFETAKKGGLRGVVGGVTAGVGAIDATKKNLGYTVDKDKNRAINDLKNKVSNVDAAKSASANELTKNKNENLRGLFKKGATVNGRTYGIGLIDDDGNVDNEATNYTLKNMAGLAQASILHGNSKEYMRLKNLAVDKAQTATFVKVTYARAKDKYETQIDAYNNSDNKQEYVASLSSDIKKNESAVFNASSRSEKEEIIAKIANVEKSSLSGFSDEQLKTSMENYLNKTYDVSVEELNKLSVTQIDTKFEKLNSQSIVTSYGHSLGDMTADLAKAEGDAKSAKEGLETYLKSGRGKADANIDELYPIADNAAKAEKLKASQEKEKRDSSKSDE